MTKRLRDEDRRAVDFLMDKMTSNSAGAAAFVATHEPVAERRLRAAEQVLELLKSMPAAEPPADLVVRTLRRIDSATGVSGELAAYAPSVSAAPNA